MDSFRERVLGRVGELKAEIEAMKSSDMYMAFPPYTQAEENFSVLLSRKEAALAEFLILLSK